MSNIDEIMCLLDWNNSPASQEKGILLAKDVKCIKAFFQPITETYGKNTWDNCATIICKRSDDELIPYIGDMVLWLRDLNWPGAEQIQARLLRFQKCRQLAMYLNDCVPALEKLQHKSWLIFIAPLLENSTIKMNLSVETIEILSRYV